MDNDLNRNLSGCCGTAVPLRPVTEGKPATAAPASEGLQAGYWSSPGMFALCMGLLLFFTYPGVICGPKSFFFRDYGVLAYPTIHYAKECFWSGELPLWNAFSNCGAPFLAQWGPAVLYPFSLIYLLLPLPWSLGLFCVLHLHLGAMGMYFLAGRWSGSSLGACLAGTAYIFNGLMFATLAWPNYTIALGWMPWVVLGVQTGWRKRGRAVVLGALAGAMQMLSGVPEIILMTWLFLGALWVLDARESGSPGKSSLAFLCTILLVAGLAAAQLLPFLDLLAHSQRDTTFGTSAWSMPGWGWANFLVPIFYCARSPQGIFYQPHYVFVTSYYLGIGLVALALLGLRSKPHRYVWLLLGSTVFSIILALGDDGYLYTWAKAAFPALGFARFPVKAVYLAGFTLPLLAAYGLSHWEKALGARTTECKRLWLISTVLLSLIVFLVWWAWEYKFPGDQWPATWHNALWRIGILGCLAGVLGFFSRSRRVLWEQALPLLLILLVWVDALTSTPAAHPVIRAGAFAPGMLEITPRPRLGQGRAMLSPDAEDRLVRSQVADFEEDFIGKRLGLWSNLNLLESIPKVEGAMTLILREEAQLQALLYGGTMRPEAALLDFLAVSHVTAPGSIIEWRTRSNALPWVTLGQRPVFLPLTNSLAALLSPDFDPREMVLLPAEIKNEVRARERSDTGTLRNQNFGRQQITFEVETAAPAMVAVAQSYYHPWKAYVDGKPTPLWRANYAFQGLEVPAGCHQVRITYEDKLFRYGAALSVITWILCLGALLWRRRAGGLIRNEPQVS